MVFPQIKAKVGTTMQAGDAAEDAALHYLQQAGLYLLQRNYRTPGRGGGEIDLIMRAADDTTVFIEVRQRKSASHGRAATSVNALKQRRIIFTARHTRFACASHRLADLMWCCWNQAVSGGCGGLLMPVKHSLRMGRVSWRYA
jgi:putative endonuclease